jgi:hypothetical protein
MMERPRIKNSIVLTLVILFSGSSARSDEPRLWPDLVQAPADLVCAAACRISPFDGHEEFQCECAAFGVVGKGSGTGQGKKVASHILLQKSSIHFGILKDSGETPFSIHVPAGALMTDGTRWYLNPCRWRFQINAECLPQLFVNGDDSTPYQTVAVDVASILKKYLEKARPEVSYSQATRTFTIRKETGSVIYLRGRTPDDTLVCGSEWSEISTVGSDHSGIRLRGCLTNPHHVSWQRFDLFTRDLPISRLTDDIKLVETFSETRSDAVTQLEETMFADLTVTEVELRAALFNRRTAIALLQAERRSAPRAYERVVQEFADSLEQAHRLARSRLGLTDDPLLFGTALQRCYGSSRGSGSVYEMLERLVTDATLPTAVRFRLAELFGECGSSIATIPPWSDPTPLAVVIQTRWGWPCSNESLEACLKALPSNPED